MVNPNPALPTSEQWKDSQKASAAVRIYSGHGPAFPQFFENTKTNHK